VKWPYEGNDLIARVDELLELVDVAPPGLKPIAPARSESLEAAGGGSYGDSGLACNQLGFEVALKAVTSMPKAAGSATVEIRNTWTMSMPVLMPRG
jgi:hypothetical protein